MPSGERVKLGLAASLYEGFRFTLQTTDLMIVMLVKIVKGEASPKNLGGPIAIAQASGESLKQGLFAFIFLVSLISINLAIINLFPIPVLDGGHLLFFLVEAVIRRPVTGKAREAATFAGLLLIGLLTVFIFYNDIMRIVTQGWSLQP
jgi:regulator of sigma E protease